MKKILALIIMVISFSRCTNDRSIPNGYELFERDNKDGLAQPITLRPVRLGCYWSPQPAGDKANLLLGSGKDTQSFLIFRCQNLSKADSGADLVSAMLAMRSSFHMGEKTPFTVTAHRVVAEWNESTVLWQDVDDAFQADPVETFEFTPRDTTWHIIPMTNLAFMREWIKDSHQSSHDIHGLILKFEQASGGSVLYSSETTAYAPYFQIVTRVDGALDTTKAVLSHDASLVQNRTNVGSETLEDDPVTLKIGNGSGYRSLVQFDLSQIPREATIHKALLTFALDRDEIYVPGASVGVSFSVVAQAIIMGSSWAPTSIVIDSTRSAAVDVAASSSDSFAFDSTSPVQSVSRIVQRWVSELTPNYGMLIYPYYQNSDFQEMAFISGVADTSRAPSLVITYSLQPAHRFAQP